MFLFCFVIRIIIKKVLNNKIKKSQTTKQPLQRQGFAVWFGCGLGLKKDQKKKSGLYHIITFRVEGLFISNIPPMRVQEKKMLNFS